MLDQVGNSESFEAFYSASGVGKTGLTVTVDVYAPSGTQIVTGAAATEIGGGFYTYALASGSTGTAGTYRAVFKTTDATVDQKHLPAVWILGKAWVAHVDADVSSRLATSGYTTPPTVVQVRQEMDTNSTKLANLDATVTSRLASSAYVVPPSLGQIQGACGSVTLAAAGLDTVTIETGINARQALSLIGAGVAGKASGLDTGSPVFQGMGNTTTRIAAITDTSGDRSFVTLTPPA